ncbi:MAG: HAMP domain-containing histidine kinase [Acidobacteriota bacterium]|nr:HAMP domain-containing histidine kinase [Acidobacteriota bacterium]
MTTHSRRILSAKPRFSAALDRWLRPLQERGALALLFLSILATTSLLYTVPMVWVSNRTFQDILNWQEARMPLMQAIGQNWSVLPNIPDFQTGHEPQVLAALREHPLLVAAVSRRDGAVWIREEGRLVPCRDASTAHRFRAWAKQAEKEGRFQWVPPKEMNPDFPRAAGLVLLGDRIGMVKLWRIGSPEVEHHLRLLQSSASRLQVGLRRADPKEQAEDAAAPWTASPNLQAGFHRGEHSPSEILLTGDAIGDGWEMVGRPLPEDEKAMTANIRFHQKAAWSAYALVAGGLSFGLYLRYRARRQERLDSNQIASLAHSLKTPLAVLKLRCDSLRMGNLSPTKTQSEFLHIGEEVDQLVVLIENGLKSLRTHPGQSPRSPVPEGFYPETAGEMKTLFEQESRELRFDIAPVPHEAHLPSLRSALATLLENALVYGRGPVRIAGSMVGALFQISVSDQGPGVSSEQLEQLGKPFMRFRQSGAEGFAHEGQGLGLSLLFQVAQREGWGLVFHSQPGAGFEARLELPQ